MKIAMTTPTMSSEEASIFSLVESGDKEALVQRLQESEDVQKELSTKNNRGKTPLDIAALLGKADIVQVLVDNGADLNRANKSGTV